MKLEKKSTTISCFVNIFRTYLKYKIYFLVTLLWPNSQHIFELIYSICLHEIKTVWVQILEMLLSHDRSGTHILQMRSPAFLHGLIKSWSNLFCCHRKLTLTKQFSRATASWCTWIESKITILRLQWPAPLILITSQFNFKCRDFFIF